MKSLIGVLVACAVVATAAQQTQRGSEAPLIFDTYTPGPCSPNGQPHGGCARGDLHRIRVVTVVTGLVRPWHIAFLPDGPSSSPGVSTMLVTELPGRLRVVRSGTLDPQPVAGWPIASLEPRTLNSVIVHPQFARNNLLYLSYSKGASAQRTTIALARGRFDGTSLTDVKEIFVADAWGAGAAAGRADFGPDGMLYLTVGDRDAKVFTDDDSARILAQDLNSHVGKVLRLRDDGTAPPDNPFVGRKGVKPEIFTYGHRNVQGLAWHPETKALWATEIGPMGGDELNQLRPGSNYGWPLVSFGKMYTGNTVSEQPYWRKGMEMPVMFWMPAISPSSLAIYSGDKFPAWRGHYFISALSGQQLLRVAFNQPLPQTERRESLLTQLDVRFRDVRQGPDGYLYVATEKTLQDGPGSATGEVPDGTVLRIEPAP